MVASIRPQRRTFDGSVDERGVVRRPQTGAGPSDPVTARKPIRVDRTKPGMPTGPVINKNKQAGSNLQKGSTGPLPFNPRRGGAGMTNQSKPKPAPKPAPKRMDPRRRLK